MIVKVKKKYVDYFTLGIFVVFAVGLITGSVSYTLVVIENPDPNSMWPTYYQGDLFVIHKTSPQDIHLGDVVVYQKSSSSDKVIHRVIDIIEHNGDYYFRVKGDNYVTNPPDTPGPVGSSSFVSYSWILGKIVARIPYLGHLSLAMQRNSGIQIMVYFISILAVIAVIAWPNDEEEEKDEMLDITLIIILGCLKSIVLAPRNGFLKIRNSKHRILIMLAVFTLLAVLFIPVFVGATINTRGNYNSLGVLSVTPSTSKILNDTLDGVDYSSEFLQLNVELVDNAGMLRSIKSFDLAVFIDNQHQDRISFTRWISLKDFTGRVIVGASIVISHELLPSIGTELYILISLHIQKDFFFHSTMHFNDSFVYNY